MIRYGHGVFLRPTNTCQRRGHEWTRHKVADTHARTDRRGNVRACVRAFSRELCCHARMHTNSASGSRQAMSIRPRRSLMDAFYIKYRVLWKLHAMTHYARDLRAAWRARTLIRQTRVSNPERIILLSRDRCARLVGNADEKCWS